MTITGGTALSKEEIDRMMRDAEAHAEEDKKRKEEAEVRNHADALLFATEKLLKEHGEKVSDEDKAGIDAAVANLRTALAGDDIAAVTAAHDALNTANQQFSEKLYAASANATASDSAEGASDASGADDDVADAEIIDEGQG